MKPNPYESSREVGRASPHASHFVSATGFLLRAFALVWASILTRMNLDAAQLRTAQLLVRRVSEVGKRPAEASTVVREELAVQARDGLDAAAERRSRAVLIAALRNDAKAGFDVGEPSWQSLATLIEETSFLQVERQLRDANFALANLFGADLSRAKMEEPVTGCPLSAASYTWGQMASGIWRCDVSGSDASNCLGQSTYAAPLKLSLGQARRK